MNKIMRVYEILYSVYTINWLGSEAKILECLLGTLESEIVELEIIEYLKFYFNGGPPAIILWFWEDWLENYKLEITDPFFQVSLTDYYWLIGVDVSRF